MSGICVHGGELVLIRVFGCAYRKEDDDDDPELKKLRAGLSGGFLSGQGLKAWMGRWRAHHT